ncbi:MAG TPA: phosphoribosylanthranilate isomerase [Deltaproteobacteria bacterium]|nr:phosphoribosylanthranilate isomerase [Deltaproteobacteria bacterium]
MWVKICGITRYEDALAACVFGADAVGFVLTRSRRRADPHVVESWIHDIRGVEKVGVFTDEDPVYIAQISKILGLDTVQLHAPLMPAHRMLLDDFRIIAALKEVEPGLEPPMIPEDFPCRVLLDPSMGTGRVGDWRLLGIPFILAGGLTPENVGQAIAQTRPFGVDVSSGVEAAPGIKDREKIRKFICEAKQEAKK